MCYLFNLQLTTHQANKGVQSNKNKWITHAQLKVDELKIAKQARATYDKTISKRFNF